MATGQTDADPLQDLTAFQRDMLVVIGRFDDPHGLAIKEALESAYDESEIHHGRLYPNLDDLVRMGLVEKGKIDARTNSYQITNRGRRELQADHEWRAPESEQ